MAIEIKTEPQFITESRRIVKEWQYATLHRNTGERVADNNSMGILVDAQTADRMVKVYDALKNPAKAEKTNEIGLVRFAHWVWKL